MIFLVEQVLTNFNMVWMATKDKQILCTAISKLQKGSFDVTLDYSNMAKYRLRYDPKEKSYGNSLKDRLSFKLFKENELLGSIVFENKKIKGFLKSYGYRILRIENDIYNLYEVGFGKDGLFLCIYKNDELVAIAEKNLKVINYKDIYKVYSLIDDLSGIVPLLLHYDVTAYGDLMEISLHSTKKKFVKTPQEELRAKFDPTFIPKIKSMEGIDD